MSNKSWQTSRRQFLKMMGLIACFPKVALSDETKLRFHDERGEALFQKSLEAGFWNTAQKTNYDGLPYDQIQLLSTKEGYVTYISGTGRHGFTPKLVADGIFKHQDLIPAFMPSLKSARYIGRGTDAKTGDEYTDIYFLADIKVFFMSVPLRTKRYDLGDGRYICSIELVTENMVSKEKWNTYQEIMRLEKEVVIERWAFHSIVPMEYLYGYYLMEPESTFGTRVTMITKMKFKENVHFLADWGAELPFVLKQGMQAGFVGSVEACKSYQKMLESAEQETD